MKTLFKKRIVDERMELQSLKNARKSWNFLLLATGFCILIEFYVFHWSFKYVAPQWITVLAAALYNLFLDARDGNIYTAEASNRKRIFLLYTLSSLITALIVAYGHYTLSSGSLTKGITMFIASFLIICSLIYLADALAYRIGKKRAESDSADDGPDQPL